MYKTLMLGLLFIASKISKVCINSMYTLLNVNDCFAFLKVNQSHNPPQPNPKTKSFWVKGVRLLPNGHTQAGFFIGTLRLATMATLH